MAKASFNQWNEMPQTEVTPQIKRRLVSGEKAMLAQFTMAKGAVMTAHQHPHEQISTVISGSLEFNIDGEKRVLNSGGVVHIPSNIPHGVTVLEDTVVLDVFSPPREDFLTGQKADYMK